MYRWLIIWLILSPICGLATAADKLVIGVHPYLPPIELIERFTPLANYLERSLGLPVSVHVGTSYQDHNESISRGELDLAFIGPANYVRLRLDGHEFSDSFRLAFSGKTRFRGAIITNKHSGITSLEEASGLRIALGDPNSTLSTLVPLYMLSQEGVDLSKLSRSKYLKNHHNVALSILVGKYNIGGVKEEVFREYEDRGLVRLKYTEWFPSHLFIVNPALSESMREKLSTALLNIDQAEGGEEILSMIKTGTTELVKNNESDFDELKEIVRRSRDEHWLQ